MAKAAKPKKKGKYDISVKTDLTFEELIKLAVTTPPLKKKNAAKKKE